MISARSRTATVAATLSAFFLAATFASAQAPGSAQPSGPGQTPGSQSMGQPNAATSNSAIPDNSAPTPSPADQSFVEDTLKDNQTQVQLSQLAQQKSPSDDVKEFSQKMVQIHTQLTTQLAPLARQLSVSQPKKPSKKEREELAKLEGLSGSDFDTAYLQQMAQVQQHTLNGFKQAAQSSNPNIQKAASVDTPTLDQNFQVLQKLAQTHNVPLDTK